MRSCNDKEPHVESTTNNPRPPYLTLSENRQPTVDQTKSQQTLCDFLAGATSKEASSDIAGQFAESPSYHKLSEYEFANVCTNCQKR